MEKERDSKTAIRLTDVGKKYRVYFEKPAIVRSLLPFLSQGPGHHEFWALREISLGIKKGECIGILGPNGAGKSTILSVLAGITDPTLGDVEINGRISALLSLGAGFQPELTGRENIYLNAAILGMKRAAVEEIFDDIVAYAGIGEFMDAKLSTYSSGMNMRLGFAIAVSVPFDILLIDELLAVGDMTFQQKCFKTIRDFTEDEDRTIIFVSHDIGRIEEMCSRAVWLEHGRVEEMDSAEVVVRKYRQKYRHKYEAFDLSVKKKQREYSAEITVDARRVLRRIPRELFGANVDWTNEGSLILDQGHGGMNRQLLRTLLPYRFAVLRYPGGQSADHFHWREAVGDERKTQIDGHSGLRNHPGFGPDEFVNFCRELCASPLITLNVGSGTVEEALGWARCLKEKGIQVPFWELGHELYYDDYHNLGRDFRMSPEEYAAKSLAIARGLREITPDSKIMFIGCKDTGVFTRYRYPHWNKLVLDACAPYMDYFSIHNATIPIMNITPAYGIPELDDTARALLAAPLYVENNFDHVCGEMKARAAEKELSIAITDYGVMFTDIPPVVHGTHAIEKCPESSVEWERNTYCASALFEAMLLNLFIRRSEVAIACRFSLLSQIYSSLYRYVDGRWIAAPQALVHMLYNRLAGHLLVQSSARCDSFDSPAVGIIPAQTGVPYLDLIAVRTEDDCRLLVFIINRNLESSIKTSVDIQGFLPEEISVKTLAAPEYYSRNTAQSPFNVHLQEQTYPAAHFAGASPHRLQVEMPKHSLMLLVCSRKAWL